MLNDIEFAPNWTSAPGETIVDSLRERGMQIDDLARRLEQSVQETQELIYGKTAISIGLARRLKHVLGGSVEFWMSRDFQYRESIARVRQAEASWLSQLPIMDMIQFGWLPESGASDIKTVLDFFATPNLNAWHAKYARLEALAAFRTSPSLESRVGAIAAWLRQGEIEAELLKCGLWNRSRFEASLLEARKLTRQKDPHRFIPMLRSIFANCGVATIVVRGPDGCRASGAARFLSPVKAMLQVSFRYLSDDQFWFTLFHEAAHILLHPVGEIIDGIGNASVSQEKAANDFAIQILVPNELQPELGKIPLNAKAVLQFAARAGISPGIVVGQLQYSGRLPHNRLNGLKRYFTW